MLFSRQWSWTSWSSCGRRQGYQFEELLSVLAAGNEFFIVALDLGNFEGFHYGSDVPNYDVELQRQQALMKQWDCYRIQAKKGPKGKKEKNKKKDTEQEKWAVMKSEFTKIKSEYF